MASRAIAAAICVLGLLPAAASARAPALRGAATHPLWSESSVADFDRELDLLREAGANMVRIDIGWSTLEQAGKGQFSSWYVAKADTFFEHARARGLRVIVTFWTTPCWASSAPPEIKQDCAGAWWERGVQAYPPSDPADFAAAAAWVAQRWGADLAALEIWNEPNYNYFFQSPDPAADYAELLKASYPAVKAAAPSVTVIGPAMLISDYEFLEDLYSEGIAGNFDGISSRPFNEGRDPNDATVPPDGPAFSFLLGVPRQREVMIAHGDGDKKLWFTELGWSSCAPGGTSIWCVSQEQQARYIADAYRIVRDRWDYVEAFSVYTLRNTGTNPNDRESQMGMLMRDFQPKPSYQAFKAVLAEPSPAPAASSPAASRPPPPAVLARARLLLSGLTLSRRRLGAGWARARLSYYLSQPARVSFTVERLRRLRRCRCARWLRFRGPFVRRGRSGVNRLLLGTLLRGRRPPSGRYRLSLRARDSVAGASALRRLSFSIR
jgi:hypothetical protein